jgi:hypothetical protein
MSRQVYRQHEIQITRDMASGLHEVKFWRQGDDPAEDAVTRGGYVSAQYGIALAKKSIDEFWEHMEQLEAT